MTKNSRQQSERFLKIASAKSMHLHQKGSKAEILSYQLGYLAGWLGRLAEHDITVRQELAILEEQLKIETVKNTNHLITKP